MAASFTSIFKGHTLFPFKNKGWKICKCEDRTYLWLTLHALKTAVLKKGKQKAAVTNYKHQESAPKRSIPHSWHVLGNMLQHCYVFTVLCHSSITPPEHFWINWHLGVTISIILKNMSMNSRTLSECVRTPIQLATPSCHVIYTQRNRTMQSSEKMWQNFKRIEIIY